MGLFDKIKDILFVEEEELPVITKKEEVVEEVKAPKKEDQPILSRQRSIKRDIEPKKEVEDQPVVKEEAKASSPFLSFDEEEFDRANKRTVTTTTKSVKDNVVKTTTTSVKRVDYKDYSRYEIKKVEERKPFRPSPVISPVYGILDKNYKKEDVVAKPRTEDMLTRDVDSIRNKAFGEVVDTIVEEDMLPKTIEEKSIDDLIMDGFSDQVDTYDEQPEEVVVNVEIEEPIEVEEDSDDVIVNDLTEDDIVDVDPIITHYDEEEVEEVGLENNEDDDEDYQLVNEHTSALEILDEIEKELNKQNDEDTKKDTLEGDLFNLIDSMYDDRKDED